MPAPAGKPGHHEADKHAGEPVHEFQPAGKTEIRRKEGNVDPIAAKQITAIARKPNPRRVSPKMIFPNPKSVM